MPASRRDDCLRRDATFITLPINLNSIPINFHLFKSSVRTNGKLQTCYLGKGLFIIDLCCSVRKHLPSLPHLLQCTQTPAITATSVAVYANTTTAPATIVAVYANMTTAAATTVAVYANTTTASATTVAVYHLQCTTCHLYHTTPTCHHCCSVRKHATAPATTATTVAMYTNKTTTPAITVAMYTQTQQSHLPPLPSLPPLLSLHYCCEVSLLRQPPQLTQVITVTTAKN